MPNIKLKNVIGAEQVFEEVKKVHIPSANTPGTIEYVYPEGTVGVQSIEPVDVSDYKYAQVVDDNLKSENIAAGVSILGIEGTHVGGVAPDGNAIESDVLEGKTFYGSGAVKRTGTIATYDGSTIVSRNGVFNTAGKYMPSDIYVNVPTSIIEVPTVEQMVTLIVAENVGKVYRFTGASNDVFINGDLYEVEVAE